jgi:hypothetical protein
VNEDLMIQEESGPRTLQPHAMETTEIKENVAK